MSEPRKRKRTLKTTKRIVKEDGNVSDASDIQAARMVYRRQGRISESSSHFSAPLPTLVPSALPTTTNESMEVHSLTPDFNDIADFDGIAVDSVEDSERLAIADDRVTQNVRLHGIS